MRYFVLLLLFLISPFSVALAQGDDAEVPAVRLMSPEDEEDFLSSGVGARGRYSEEQCALAALREVPGRIVGRDSGWQNKRFYYEFSILVSDGSVYEVEMDAGSLDVYEIEVVSLVRDPKFPFSVVSKDDARRQALSYTYAETHGRRKPVILEEGIGVHRRHAVYEFMVKKSAQTYRVKVDVRSGNIVDFSKRP